jgi:mRNA interferase HigB
VGAVSEGVVTSGTLDRIVVDSLLAAFPYVSIINDQRVVFNIKGNDYRVVAAIHYDRQRMFVRGVFTHAEYDRIDVRTI